MDKLFFTRISDRTRNVIELNRIDSMTKKVEKITIFEVGGKVFTFTIDVGTTICWIAELGPYDKPQAKNFPAKKGNPGGYPIVRIKLIWQNEALEGIRSFISSTHINEETIE